MGQPEAPRRLASPRLGARRGRLGEPSKATEMATRSHPIPRTRTPLLLRLPFLPCRRGESTRGPKRPLVPLRSRSRDRPGKRRETSPRRSRQRLHARRRDVAPRRDLRKAPAGAPGAGRPPPFAALQRGRTALQNADAGSRRKPSRRGRRRPTLAAATAPQAHLRACRPGARAPASHHARAGQATRTSPLPAAPTPSLPAEPVAAAEPRGGPRWTSRGSRRAERRCEDDVIDPKHPRVGARGPRPAADGRRAAAPPPRGARGGLRLERETHITKQPWHLTSMK